MKRFLALFLGFSLVLVACSSDSRTIDAEILDPIEYAINYGFAQDGLDMWEMPDGSRCVATAEENGNAWIVVNDATIGTRWYGFVEKGYDGSSCFPFSWPDAEWNTKRWVVKN